MENNRHRKSTELAAPATPFRIYGPPSQLKRGQSKRGQSERGYAGRGPRSYPHVRDRRPGIEIDLGRSPRQQQQQPFSPGDVLTCDYSVQNPAHCKLSAIEASVIWSTCGKGDQDIGVHFFERRLILSSDQKTGPSHRLSTVLPASPLSYDGQIVKLGWRVRVRLFLADNSQITQDQPFTLGAVSLCEAPKVEADDSIAEPEAVQA